MQILRGSFRPEFINRIDEIIVFHALSEEQLLDITRLLLDRLERRLHAQRIDAVFTDDAVRFLAQEGYDPEYGARPLRRTITRLVENELSRLVLGGTVEPGDRVMVEVEDGKLRFDVEKGVFERTSEDEAAREKVGAGVSE
jgi:ATP-dependent Clp protease ATP-binding subunit ClpC